MVLPTLDIENSLWQKGYQLVCGLDEVGRGSFAGPVVVGAVIFPPEIILPEGIADSKLLSAKKRVYLAEKIKAISVKWSIGKAGVETINQIGIGKAAQVAFRQAVVNLKLNPDFLLIDAFFINLIDRAKQKAIPDGDKICVSISAASIIAKVYRDGLMVELHEKYPQYNFAKHKGYGTLEHRQAIKKYGLCDLHRKSFNLGKFL